MIQNIFNGPAADLAANLFLAVGLGVVLRECFRFLRHPWAGTPSSILVFSLLPAATFSVTSIISGNIALSLGMVGALSIIRFRNPVRSPAELVAYFLLVTIGICLTKDKTIAVLLVTLVILVSAFLRLVTRIYGINRFNVTGWVDSSSHYLVNAEAAEQLDLETLARYQSFLTFQRADTQDGGRYEYQWVVASHHLRDGLLSELEEVGRRIPVEYSSSTAHAQS